MTWTLVVPSRSDEKILGLIENLLASHPDVTPDQIVIVDDGLSRRTRRELRDVTIVKGQKPFVYPRAINMGVAATDADSDLVICGDDVRFLNYGTIEKLAMSASGVAAIAPEVVGVCGQPAQRVGSGQTRADWLAFICAYIPRTVWDAVGELDERFVGYGYDDVDWCVRAKEHGPFVVDHTQRVEHVHDISCFRSDDEWKQRYTENRDRFVEKWPQLGGQ